MSCTIRFERTPSGCLRRWWSTWLARYTDAALVHMDRAVALPLRLAAPGNDLLGGTARRPPHVCRHTVSIARPAVRKLDAIGKMTIDGVQGRYILPLLPWLGFLTPAYDRDGTLISPSWILVVASSCLVAVLPEQS